MKPRPKWLEDQIEASRRAAKPAICRCGSDVLKGPSGDPPYWVASVDIQPVELVDEVIARCTSRFTYDAIPRHGETHLHVRGIEQMRRPPRYPVLIDHQCEGP